MNKRCQIIVEVETDGKASVQINGVGRDVLFATAMLVEDVCEAAKIPTAAFAMALPMFADMKRQLNNNRLKIDWGAIRKEMERGG